MITYDICIASIRKILPLLHPYTPFITEELWSFFKSERSDDLIISPWTTEDKDLINKEIDSKMMMLQDIISAVRAIRSRMNIPPSKKIEIKIKSEQNQTDINDQKNE